MSEAAPQTQGRKRPNFKEMARQEVETLSKQREELKAKQAEIDTQLAEIDAELDHLNLYLNPPPPQATREPSAQKRTRKASTGGGKRQDRSGLRDDIVKFVAGHPNAAAKDVLDNIPGARDDKATYSAVTQLLGKLVNEGKLRSDGKGRAMRYFPTEDGQQAA